MTESSTSSTQRAPRRSTATQQRMERARQLRSQQRAEQQRREKQVDEGLKFYMAATDKVDAAEQRAEAKVAELQRKIDEERAKAESKIADVRGQQATAVRRIQEAGLTVEQIAELLELGHKKVRELLTAAKEAPASGADTDEAENEGDGDEAGAAAEPASGDSGPQVEPSAVVQQGSTTAWPSSDDGDTSAGSDELGSTASTSVAMGGVGTGW